MSNEINMKQYGLSETVKKSAERFADLTVSRVLSQEKGIYRLVSSQGEKWGEISGRFHYDVQAKSEYPAVGDFVMVDWNKSSGNAVIHHVLPRKSSFIRKSTLINCLLGEKYLDTNGLRNDDKGRHTTTHRELILLPSGGMVIDTPGMRELGMWDAEAGIDQTFSDIETLAKHCRFRDCTHSGSEPGCAVQDAIERGELSIDRLCSYQKLMNENRYMENSQDYLAEKKQKFKNIAKMNKKNRKR